ncbi:MAG: hypothetical protein ACRYGB_14530 [Janthinobacterium lividum]
MIFYSLLPTKDKTFINVLSIIGFLLSLLGIVIAYLQILSIKQIAVDTQNEIKENIRLSNNLFMLSDISRKVAMVNEIQGYFLRDENVELCILRMTDLKVILNSIKNQEHYRTLITKRNFLDIFQNFNLDLNNLNKHIINNPRNKIDKIVISEHLEEMSTLFLSVETKLKNPQL